MKQCKICGDAVKTETARKASDSELCSDCKLLRYSSEHLMNKSPHKAIYYFMDMFMQSRKRTLSEDKLKSCIWEAWWNNQKKQLPNQVQDTVS